MSDNSESTKGAITKGANATEGTNVTKGANAKNPKRVAAGKKGAEAKKIKNELKRKETESIKKENMELKSITKDDTKSTNDINIYKNYIPLCFVIGVVGVAGLYMYKSIQHKPEVRMLPVKHDPFEI